MSEGSVIKRVTASRLFWPLAGLALLLLFNAFVNPSFFAVEIKDGRLYGNLVDVLNRGSIVMILALGMTLVIATGGVDLSVGATMALAGTTAALLLENSGVSIPVAIIAALLVALAAGVWNGILVTYAGIQPIVATLILMVAGRGVATFLVDEKSITIQREGFEFLGRGHFLGLPFSVTLVVIVFTITALAVRKTALGLFLEAVGDNEIASRYAGIGNRGIKLLAYGFCGLCAGIVGLIDTSNIMVADPKEVGWMAELYAIFAVVVGGTALTGGRFSLIGSVIGALLLQTLWTTMFSTGVPSDTAPVPMAVVIVVVCLFQSETFRMRSKRLLSRT